MVGVNNNQRHVKNCFAKQVFMILIKTTPDVFEKKKIGYFWFSKRPAKNFGTQNSSLKNKIDSGSGTVKTLNSDCKKVAERTI